LTKELEKRIEVTKCQIKRIELIRSLKFRILLVQLIFLSLLPNHKGTHSNMIPSSTDNPLLNLIELTNCRHKNLAVVEAFVD